MPVAEGLQPRAVERFGPAERERHPVRDDCDAPVLEPFDRGRERTPGVEVLGEDLDELQVAMPLDHQGELGA